MIPEARFVIETNVGFSEEHGPWEGGRMGFAIGERVFWTDAFYNDNKPIYEAKRAQAQAIVDALNDGRLFAEVEPAPAPVQPPPGPYADGWRPFDGKTAPQIYSPPEWIKLRFADGTETQMPAGFDWFEKRDNPVVAWFDEIPF